MIVKLFSSLFRPYNYSARICSSRTIKMSSNRIPSERVRDSKPSIWVEFTTLAVETKAVNIGQGFPDTPMPKFVSDLLLEVSKHPERTDWHQYTRGFGHARFVNILAKLYSRFLENPVNPQTDVLVTVGAYLALYYSFLGWLNHGDEVIVIEPAYDSYCPQIKMAGGVPIPVVLTLSPNPTSSSDYKLDIAAIEAKITQRTKMLILNNPHNPTGKLFTKDELLSLAELVTKYDLIVIADEVYEWHIYPGHEMIRFASLPGMFERTITIGSAGKAFSATGWKLGWALGPAPLLAPLKTIHQNCTFTCSTPTQEAIARAFEMDLELIEQGKNSDSHLLTGLASELLPKRDLLAQGLREAGLTPIIPEAGYFMIANFSKIDWPGKNLKLSSDDDPLDFHFVRWLCKERKLATIPPSAFYSLENKNGNDHFVRLCFFKSDETLLSAIDILKQLKKT